MSYPDKCPSCNTNLIGELIPEHQQHLYGGKNFYRVIGIYDMELDRTVKWKCPDCEHQWPVRSLSSDHFLKEVK